MHRTTPRTTTSPLGSRPSRPAATIARAALVVATAAIVLDASTVSAQRHFTVDARSGSGASIGGGDGQATVRHTPTYLEAGIHSWSEDQSDVVLGGALRVEVEDRASIGGVVRAGLRWTAGDLELRPSIALAAILAPYTLVGPEAGVMAIVRLAAPVSLVFQVVVDGWVFGSDLVPGTALVMVNGALGVEIAL